MRMRGCGGWSRRRWDLWVTWRGGGWGMAHPAATSGQVRKSRCPSRAGGTGICVGRSVVMATMVLTLVGGIVCRPGAAALGVASGRQADGAVFETRGREGPGVVDIKVLAAHYVQHNKGKTANEQMERL